MTFLPSLQGRRSERTLKSPLVNGSRGTPFPAVPVGATLELVVTMGITAGGTTKRRRCAFKRCRRLLSKDASVLASLGSGCTCPTEGAVTLLGG